MLNSFILGMTVLMMAAGAESAGGTAKEPAKSSSKNGKKGGKGPTGDGWNDETEADIEGWFKPEDDAELVGKLVGYIQIADKRKQVRDVAVIQLAEDCPFAVVDKKKTTLKKGQNIGLGLRAKIQGIVMYKLGSGIWVRAVEKQELDNGQTMWKFEWKGKGEKYPEKPAPQRTNLTENELASSKGSDDEPDDYFA